MYDQHLSPISALKDVQHCVRSGREAAGLPLEPAAVVAGVGAAVTAGAAVDCDGVAPGGGVTASARAQSRTARKCLLQAVIPPLDLASRQSVR